MKTYLFFLAIVIAGAGGWIANLVKLLGMGGDSITTLFILRLIGVFAAPLGAILGYF